VIKGYYGDDGHFDDVDGGSKGHGDGDKEDVNSDIDEPEYEEEAKLMLRNLHLGRAEMKHSYNFPSAQTARPWHHARALRCQPTEIRMPSTTSDRGWGAGLLFHDTDSGFATLRMQIDALRVKHKLTGALQR
jgi:hypothetical protein